MRKLMPLLLLALALVACETKPVVPAGGFDTYAEAAAYARDLGCEENTDPSSFILRAEYCGDHYLIMNLNGREYIFAGVPESV